MYITENPNAVTTTVGQIVANDMRAAKVFKQLGIDFCCHGKRSLPEACERAGIPASLVLEKLSSLPAPATAPEPFDTWSLDVLAEYLLNVSHQYLHDNLPAIAKLVDKVTIQQSHRHPSLRYVKETFDVLKEDLREHLQKEEASVFPLIRRRQHRPSSVGAVSLQEAIRRMEDEHDDAGVLLFQLREFTNDFTPPAGACLSHRQMLAKLAELEANLLQHIHLENNLLFPKALEMPGAQV